LERILFIYLTGREILRESMVGEGETGSLPSREPDMGLDPRTLES